MRRELHEYLDGERDLDDLPPELQEQARSWDRTIEDYRDSSERSAPAWIGPKVLRQIEDEESAAPGWEQWIQRALVPLAAAALVLVVWTQPWQRGEAPPAADDRPTASAEAEREGATAEDGVTRFRLEAPDAERVEVAGSFTDWRPTMELEDPDGDGVWTGSAPLEAGVHQYMFVVDGEQWVTDPNADRYVADGFGNRNAVVAVAP